MGTLPACPSQLKSTPLGSMSIGSGSLQLKRPVREHRITRVSAAPGRTVGVSCDGGQCAMAKLGPIKGLTMRRGETLLWLTPGVAGAKGKSKVHCWGLQLLLKGHQSSTSERPQREVDGCVPIKCSSCACSREPADSGKRVRFGTGNKKFGLIPQNTSHGLSFVSAL